MRSSSFCHFLLTRFNLRIWHQDKNGSPVRTTQWLEHRFGIFERYCLPAVANQTCKDFEWIVLFDSKTPEKFKNRIEEYRKVCPQMVAVFVDPEKGRFFAKIFRDEVCKRINDVSCRVLTTYLDNDDALEIHFVEDLQRRSLELAKGTFIFYTIGYQLFTDYDYVMRIHYPKNHFASVVEDGDPSTVKTIYGFGSHYFIDRIPGVRIEKVESRPMWCEVIHEKNMGNDAYFLFGTKMVRDESLLKSAFGIQQEVEYGAGIYLFRFMPRYLKTLYRRVGYKLFGRKW